MSGHDYCRCGACRVSWMREGRVPGCFDGNSIPELWAIVTKTCARLDGIKAGDPYGREEFLSDLADVREEAGRPRDSRDEWVAHLRERLTRERALDFYGRPLGSSDENVREVLQAALGGA